MEVQAGVVALLALAVGVLWALGWALLLLVLRPLLILRRLRAQGIPGYPFRPLTGQIPDMMKVQQRRDSDPAYAASTPPTLFWDEGCARFGSRWFLTLGRYPTLCLTDVALVRRVFIERYSCFTKNHILTSIRLLGDGLLTSSGPSWSRQRRLISPAFSHKELKRIFPTVVVCASDALERVEAALKQRPREPVPADEVFSNLTLDVICRSAFGAHLESLIGPRAVNDLCHSFPEFLRFSLMAGQREGMIPFFRYLPVANNRRLWKLEKVIGDAVETVVSERLTRQRQRQRKAGDSTDSRAPEETTDLLELMIEATDLEGPSEKEASTPELRDGEGKGASPVDVKERGETAAERTDLLAVKETVKKAPGRLSAELLKANCITFLLGGHDTAGNLLTWTSVLLSQHPEWQDRAREEVNSLYEANNGRTPSFEQLSELKVLGWIINESMRLFPPVPVVGRRCIKETSLSKELTIPKGCSIVFPIAIMHRSKEIWGEDADVFRPDRFADGASKAASQPNAFMPFGLGPRTCIGQAFAVAEAKAILAMFLHKFSWRLSKGYQHYPELSFTLRAKRGVPLDITIL